MALSHRRLAEGVGEEAGTLIACSGGADSAALLIGLACSGIPCIAGHVVHDMRPRAEALADRDAVRALAERLNVRFLEATAAVGGGNVEAAARATRYAALRDMAAQAGVSIVATGHHADDQFETMVLALMRGAGPRGLAGVAPARLIGEAGCGDISGEAVRLVRPMLGLTRSEAEAICRAAGYPWRDDRTNLDTGRARAALRHGPLAALRGLRPGAAPRASEAADLLRDAAGLIEDRVEDVFGAQFVWPRDALRAEREIVVGAGLRRAALRLAQGAGADDLPRRKVASVVRAIRDQDGRRRRFEWPQGLVVEVDRAEVRLGAGRLGDQVERE